MHCVLTDMYEILSLHRMDVSRAVCAQGIDNVDTLPMEDDNHFAGQAPAPADGREEVEVEICNGKVSFGQETEKGEGGEPCLKTVEEKVGEKASREGQDMPPLASENERATRGLPSARQNW